MKKSCLMLLALFINQLYAENIAYLVQKKEIQARLITGSEGKSDFIVESIDGSLIAQFSQALDEETEGVRAFLSEDETQKVEIFGNEGDEFIYAAWEHGQELGMFLFDPSVNIFQEMVVYDMFVQRDMDQDEKASYSVNITALGDTQAAYFENCVGEFDSTAPQHLSLVCENEDGSSVEIKSEFDSESGETIMSATYFTNNPYDPEVHFSGGSMIS
ncbi:MAG: hypothetical protein KC505_10940 [Myxococcales bacterium]|nr:hypothetical protein [Myxococcales bacterium]USN49863.1 MAG: hypothetical protein H6731_06170 [Myxococcales bacterium]